MRGVRALLLSALAAFLINAAAHGQQTNYCSLKIPDYSAGIMPDKDAPAEIVQDVLKRGVQITRQPDFQSIGVANDPGLTRRIAVAVMCGSDRYIFFDAGVLAEMKKSGSDWARYFVFAHEIAHHVHLDPLTVNRDPYVELNADEDAAKWLTRMGADIKDIVRAIDALNPAKVRENGYPAECERVFAAIRGYNATARDYNRFSANMKLYQEGNCALTEVSSAIVVTVSAPPPESPPTVVTIVPTPPASEAAATASPANQNPPDRTAAPFSPAATSSLAAGLNAYVGLFPGFLGMGSAPRVNSVPRVESFPGYQRPGDGEYVKIVATGFPNAVDANTLNGYFSEYLRAPPRTDATFHATRILRLEATEDNGVTLNPSGCDGIVVSIHYRFEDPQGAVVVNEGSGSQSGVSCIRRAETIAERDAAVDAIKNLEIALAGAGGPR